ncbi:MAG: alpha-L-rhamnosidase [Anaerolineae bacterium]
MRKMIRKDPFLTTPPEDLDAQDQWHTGLWPASWISHPACSSAPSVTAYRRRFTLDEDEMMRVHVTADERYMLYLDGERVGRGPERGDRRNWFFESYDLALGSGQHVLVAIVWALGDEAPLAQFSVRPGFLLAADEDRWHGEITTGVAPWETTEVGGITLFADRLRFGAGANFDVNGATFNWGVRHGEGGGWIEPEVGPRGVSRGGYDHHGTVGPDQWLRPAILPPMVDKPWEEGVVRYVTSQSLDTYMRPTSATDIAVEHQDWHRLLRDGTPLTIPPGTERRVLIDLEDYVCAYTQLVTSGGAGALVRVRWAESLYEGELSEWWEVFGASKGDRDEIEGKTFVGEGDAFRPDGGDGRVFENLWWNGGRYVQVDVRTSDEPLHLRSLTFLETRYPLTPMSRFEIDDPRFGRAWPIMVRALQMCSHETFMDCPYYEQLMYVGDTRLEALVTYCLARDDRLPRKAIEMFYASRFPEGLTQSRYPCRSTQVIPPFSLWWCGMVYDHARWRDDEAFIRRMMPGVRGVLDAFWSYRNEGGLVEAPPGWNYTDWTRAPGWHRGTPPDGEGGVSGILNWHFALVLVRAAELETWLGEPENAARWLRYAQAMAEAAIASFWDDERGLFTDDLDHAYVSEHAQCLALLSGLLDEAHRERVTEALVTREDLTRATIYFSHYLFETYYQVARIDKLFARLNEWFELADLGFKTTREAPEPSRSDCHAWGAHPIYHGFASILGIRPASFGFRSVQIHPMLGPSRHAEATLVHPSGEIGLSLTKTAGDGLEATIGLPDGVSGTFHYESREYRLHPGLQRIEVEGGEREEQDHG